MSREGGVEGGGRSGEVEWMGCHCLGLRQDSCEQGGGSGEEEWMGGGEWCSFCALLRLTGKIHVSREGGGREERSVAHMHQLPLDWCSGTVPAIILFKL